MDMHRSRLAGFIIDCQGADPYAAARFWGRALGMAPQPREGEYARLDAGPRDLQIEVQRVAHESRLHLDIETDDIPAEVARLERLGARRAEQTHAGTWVVMIAPTGQRFCVVRAKQDLTKAPGASVWEEA
jgi:hypothetical protein